MSAILLLLIDFMYLNAIKHYFNTQIRNIQGSDMKVNIYGAILCYIFLIFGINYFILKDNKSILEAFLLGFVIYGVYETTNYALLSNWSIWTVFIDTIWGGILFALTVFIVYKIKKYLD